VRISQISIKFDSSVEGTLSLGLECSDGSGVTDRTKKIPKLSAPAYILFKATIIYMYQFLRTFEILEIRTLLYKVPITRTFENAYRPRSVRTRCTGLRLAAHLL